MFLISSYGLHKTLKNEIDYNLLRNEMYNDAKNLYCDYLYTLEGEIIEKKRQKLMITLQNFNEEKLKKLEKFVYQISDKINKYNTKDILVYFEIN
jgi:hypothetical protein